MKKVDHFLERIMAAKEDGQLLDQLIEEYQPFIKKVVSKLRGRYIDESNDLYSIGLIAFKHAVDSYDHKKGKFINYAELVIRSRCIDYLRKEKRVYDREVFEEFDSNDELMYEESNQFMKQSLEAYSKDQINEIRKLEIQELTRELSKFNITLYDLTKVSPKQNRLRKLYMEISQYIINHSELIKEVMDNGRIPIKELEEIFEVNRKKIERGRKYIIALIVILNGDFRLIQDYIKWDD